MYVNFLVDGFNLYHSIDDLQRKQGLKCKWLDVKSLLKAYLPLIDKRATLGNIYYFTTIRWHKKDTDYDTISRHLRYIKVLQDLNIKVVYGRFKPRKVYCKECSKTFTRYEEKRTDVGIASKLFELGFFYKDDINVVLTGDTDLSPAIESFKKIYPDSKIYIMFPLYRKNKELMKFVDGQFRIKVEKYEKHQLPDPVFLSNGNVLHKPDSW